MTRLVCDGRELELAPGISVLTALIEAGVKVPNSCRAGACQACLVQVTDGVVPEGAQRGLKDALRAQGYILACQAVPRADLAISLAGAKALELSATLRAVERLGVDMLRVRLLPAEPFPHRAGQFLTLIRQDGLARSYSIASLPAEGAEIELHVRIIPGGRMSGWLASPAGESAAVRVRGPAGECFYTRGRPERSLVLVGVGSGLAPLWGILRDALAAGHHGPIQLWHAARSPERLYFCDELRGIAALHRNFSYRPCALEPGLEPALERGVQIGPIDELLAAAGNSFADSSLFLCGDAEIVQRLKRKVFLLGASLQDIHADAFVGAP